MRDFTRCLFLIFSFFLLSTSLVFTQNSNLKVKPGAENYEQYLPLLKNKKVAVVGNQSSRVNGIHLVDFLLSKQIEIVKIFSPEHGFRGVSDAGEKIKNDKDRATGIPIVSLYGKHFQPTAKDMRGIELLVFDLQDVGVRFYTYLSTLHYVMQACAEHHVPMILLDRPNPNAHYIDGPVLNMHYSSFVGMHPVPVVYGMSIGEYAQMINGEAWLKNSEQCDLRVIACTNWNRNQNYKLPVKPSPNLPNSLAVSLYPSLCFFEGTVVSAGRGTHFPFQCFGHPQMKDSGFYYQPQSMPGASKYPKFKGQKCYGIDLRSIDENVFRQRKQLDLSFLLGAYRQLHGKTKFFNAFFTNLAGGTELRHQIERGLTEDEIRKSWQKDLEDFKQIRKKYLIYPDCSEGTETGLPGTKGK